MPTDTPASAATDLFGRVRMGYVLVESRRLEDWHRFGAEGLGAHADRHAREQLALRLDDHARRLIVCEGPEEDVIAIGWELDDEAALDTALARLREHGVSVQEMAGEQATLRGVERFWRFEGPKRMGIELFTRPICTSVPLRMLCSGFYTGASGMGHAAITTREPRSFLAFWQEIFDARISDRIEDRLNGLDLDFTFLRMNERHHTIAIASTRGVRMDPLRTRVHHLNLQAARLEDVTAAYLRCRKLGYGIANGIGQHPNDKELSFYVESPSGFEIELGWNPILVHDEAAWQEGRYRGISLWGHFPENLSFAVKAGRVGRGLASLARSEFQPLA